MSNFSSIISDALKTAGPQIGQALGSLAKNVLTAANLTKCINCTESKIEDRLNKSPKNDGSTSAPTKDCQPIQQPVNNKQPISVKPVPEQQFVDYPEKFTESAGIPAKSVKVTNWSYPAMS